MRNAPTLRSLVDPQYLKLLRSEVPAHRRVAVEALGRTGDRRSVDLLIVSLHDLDVDVTFEAAKMLAGIAGIGTDAAVDGLLGVAFDERCPMVRRVAAATALGGMTAVPERAMTALGKLAARADPWLQSTAKQALVRGPRD